MFSQINIPTIVGAAAIDSINPCAFAILIFLGTYLTAIKANKKILPIGMAYIATVYVVYFLSGLGLLSAIASLHLTRLIYYIASGLLIVLGLIDIKDALKSHGEPWLKIPERAKPAIEKWTKRASLPAAIVLGFLVAAFELPCTGGIYLAIITMLSSASAKNVGALYLALYNLIFVLPLIVILIIINLGETSDKVKAWQSKNKRLLRFFLGLGMTLLGLLMGLGVI